MALVNRSFSVNVTPGMMPTFVHVSEYDVGRAYTVSILDEQGNTFTIPSGTTASIEGTLNGKVGFTQSATVSNNQVSFTLSESMTAYSGKAWCKIKLTQNSQPIQTCAFILAVDRAGVEAGTITGSPSFQEQINQGVAEYFDNDPPFFELPSGGQSGQALLSDGADGAFWGEAGIPEAVKTALLDCFENVAWINEQGQTYYNALYAALYSETPIPPTPPTPTTEYNGYFIDLASADIVDGYINDQGQTATLANSHFVDKFYPAGEFMLMTDNGVIQASIAATLRLADYDSSKQFLDRQYTQSGYFIAPSSNASYVKIGWTLSSLTPTYAVVANGIGDLLVNAGKTIDANGDLADENVQSTTDFIHLNSETKYFLHPDTEFSNNTVKVAFYDANKAFISREYLISTSASNYKIGNIPTGAVYFRACCSTEYGMRYPVLGV